MSVPSNNDLGALIVGVGATGSVNSPDQTNPYGRGLKVCINMALIGTGSVTVTVQGKDPTSQTYYPILASAAIVANGFSVLTVYPALTAAANVTASDVMPRQWRISATANNANPTNYTVSATVLV